MRWPVVILVGTSLTIFGCGSDDGGAVQAELADLFIALAPAETPGGVDEDCIRDTTAELSDEDAQFVIDNIDNSDVEPSADLQAWSDRLATCLLDDTDGDSSEVATTIGESSESSESSEIGESSESSGSAQDELAARLIEQSSVAGLGINEECARANAVELSDDDARFLLDNFFTTIDLETTSAAQQEWIDSIVDCLL